MPIIDDYHDIQGRRHMLTLSVHPNGDVILTRTLGRDDEHATTQIESIRIEARARDALAAWFAVNPPAHDA